MSKKRTKSIQETKRIAGIEIIAALISVFGTLIAAVFGIGTNVISNWLSQHPNFWATAAIVVGGLLLVAVISLLFVRLKDAILTRSISNDESLGLLCPKGGLHDWETSGIREVCKKCGTKRSLK